jgi:hypothetical protein
MIRIPRLLACAAFALAFFAAPHADAAAQSGAAQSSAAHWRGGRSEQAIDQAVRYYGFRPNRLTRHQIEAIQQAWTDLLGRDARTRPLTRAQATAIVYMALVHPHEEDGWYDEGRYGRGRGGRGGGGYDDDRPPYRGDEACVQMEADAYRLESLVIEAGSGLFILDPDRSRARTLTRQIQQQAVECRASQVADRAGDILRVLSDPMPSRSAVETRVEALKVAIRQSTPGRRRDGR